MVGARESFGGIPRRHVAEAFEDLFRELGCRAEGFQRMAHGITAEDYVAGESDTSLRASGPVCLTIRELAFKRT